MDMCVVFHFLASTNNAAVNIHVQVFVWTYVLLGEELLGYLVTLGLTF